MFSRIFTIFAPYGIIFISSLSKTFKANKDNAYITIATIIAIIVAILIEIIPSNNKYV